MRRTLSPAALLLAACLPAMGQVTPIPWHPKTAAPAPGARVKAPGKAQNGPKAPPAPAEAGGKYNMTFDRLTTLSPGVYVAEGNVRFTSGEMLLTCDSLTYDSNKGTLWGTGQVAVDWQDFTATGSELSYDLNKGTGLLKDAYGVQQDGDFTVAGKEILKTGPDWYELRSGTFTSCAAAVEPWSMAVSKARFHVDHYAFLTNPTFRVRGVPILYSPYLIWPIKPERSSGLLIPDIGSSTFTGFSFSNALFLAPADWWDTTTYLDYYQDKGIGVGQEFRYALTPRSYGWFHGYYIRQKDDHERRWDFSWTHVQDLRRGWYFLADVNLLSDINFPRDYSRDYARGTLSGTDSRIYLTRNWGPYSFNAKLERRLQYFTEDRDLQQRTLPGFEFRSSLQPLAGGLYGGFESSADRFEKEWADYSAPAGPVKHSVSYGRFDLHPFVELPWHPTLWLDVVPRLELRATYYGESLDPAAGEYEAGPLWRRYAAGTVQVNGPRFFRKFGDGKKHVVEPYAVYTNVSSDSPAYRAPVFDEVDQVALGQETLRYGVRNRLYGAKGGLLLESDLYQTTSFKQPLSYQSGRTSKQSPVTLLLRAWPSGNWSGDLRLRYSVLSHGLESESFSLAYKPRSKESDDFVRLTYLRTEALGVSGATSLTQAPPATELKFSSNLTLVDGRVSLNPYVERDLKNAEWRNLRLIFWYHGSCYSLGFEVGRRTIGDFRDTTYRFLVSLKGAGTVVDLNGGTGNYYAY